jgi:hypothetical protein
MIKLKDLMEAYDKVTDLLSDPQNNEKSIHDLLDDFKSRGGEILGQGRYATVLKHSSWKHVIKIFSNDVHYLMFVRFALQNPRPSFPIFYDKPRKIIPNYKRHKTNTYLYVVKTELLNPISIKEYDNIQYYLYYDLEHSKLMMDKEKSYRNGGTWTFIYNKLNKLNDTFSSLSQFKQDYNFLINYPKNFGSPDFHSKNIMRRDDGSYVLADPFWEGESIYQTHDRLLKAEMGYDDYDYDDDLEKDMVKGGEKYKIPKINPPKRVDPPATDYDDEIPF